MQGSHYSNNTKTHSHIIPKTEISPIPIWRLIPFMQIRGLSLSSSVSISICFSHTDSFTFNNKRNNNNNNTIIIIIIGVTVIMRFYNLLHTRKLSDHLHVADLWPLTLPRETTDLTVSFFNSPWMVPHLSTSNTPTVPPVLDARSGSGSRCHVTPFLEVWRGPTWGWRAFLLLFIRMQSADRGPSFSTTIFGAHELASHLLIVLRSSFRSAFLLNPSPPPRFIKLYFFPFS